ncbi:MAG: signal peptidase II [Pseudomonadota bacterium]
MPKKNLIFVSATLAFIIPILVDQGLKFMVKNGILSLSEVSNPGIFLGWLSQISPMLRIVCISTAYGLIFFLFLLIQYLLVKPLTWLRLGLSFFVGGITGNTIDRTIYGYAIDFLPLGNGLYFNPADFFQWIGLGLTLYSIFKFQEQIWHPNCVRNSYLINTRFQVRFALKLTLIGMCLAIILGGLSLSFLTVFSHNFSSQEIFAFSLSFISVSALYMVITFIAGLIISFRSAGPLYAFELFIEDLLKGKNRSLKLRSGDNYRHLEYVAEKIRVKMFQNK